MHFLLLLAVDPSFANSSGITGRSTSGCGSGCHGSAASATTTVTFSPASTTVAPGSTVAVSFIVAHATQTGAGFNVSATGGTLNAGSNNRKSGSELTHSSRQTMSAGSYSFNFTWTAPTTEGTYTFRGAGNAVNSNNNNSGDLWNTTSYVITVDDGCDDLDGDGFEYCDDGTGTDCDDADPGVYPGAVNYCDGVPDTDCDGLAEDEEADLDVDGVTECDGDCDDLDWSIYPGAEDTCEDGIDQDCNGTDEVCAGAACSVTLNLPAEGADLTAEGRFSWTGDCDGYWLEVSPDPTFPPYDTIYNARLTGATNNVLVFPAEAWTNVSRRFADGGYARVRGGELGDVVESATRSFDTTSAPPLYFPTPVASCATPTLVEPADSAVITGEPTFRWATTCTAGRLEFSTDPSFPLEDTVVVGAFSSNSGALNAARWTAVAVNFPAGGYWRVVVGATDGEHASAARWFTTM